MLFALLQVHRNQQIVVLVPWLCGSVNLTANENIHHGEERRSFFCCSARFRWSRHQPGYVQGGQEVGRDYLLLRIHVKEFLAQQQYCMDICDYPRIYFSFSGRVAHALVWVPNTFPASCLCF